MKKIVTVELADAKKTYTGRFLGLIDDKEFHTIISKRRNQGKIFSAETMPLSKVAENYMSLDGLRFVMALKEADGQSTKNKTLFISDKLSYIAAQTTPEDYAILSENDEYYELWEKV